MPRRVLLMIGSMRGGGSERQTLLLLRHLDRDRFAPQLYLGERAGELLSEVPADVPVHAYSDSAPSTPARYLPGRILRRQTRHLSELLRRERIEVVYDRTFHMSLIAGPAAARAAVPRVATIVSPPEYALPLLEKRFLVVKRWRLAQAYRRASAVVAVSRTAAASAERYYRLRAGSIRVLANPVDREAVREAAAGGAPPRPPGQQPTLVCVGRMTAEKGHHDFLDALRLVEEDRNPPLRIWMIGDGPLRSGLEEAARTTLRRHEVEFFGALANPLPAIAAADALVCPSWFEGMPNVVLEAMALGTPVVATRAGGTVELQRDVPTLFWAEPGDPPSLARAVIELLGDPHAAKRRAENALAMLRRHHDLRTNVQAIEQLLAEAAV